MLFLLRFLGLLGGLSLLFSQGCGVKGDPIPYVTGRVPAGEGPRRNPKAETQQNLPRSAEEDAADIWDREE